MAAHGTRQNLAEDEFHLALVLVDLRRYDEAEALLARAVEVPVFGPWVATTRASIAGKQERWTDALEQLREARRLLPNDLGVILEFARVAQKTGAWDQADEALRWAKLVHPEAAEAGMAIVEMFLAQGDRNRARAALDEFERSFGKTPDAVRLEQAVTSALDPRSR
jgi:predicted Zn-dependent protease